MNDVPLVAELAAPQDRPRFLWQSVCIMVHTVLFAQAVCLGQPMADLSISTENWSQSDVTIAPVLPQQSEACRIHLRVHNHGPADARNVVLRLVVEPPSASDPWISELRLKSVPAQASIVDVVQFRPDTNGLHKVIVTIDPEDAVPETNDDNNTAALTFPVVRRNVLILYHANSNEPLMRMRYQTHVTYGGGRDERTYWTRRGVRPLLHRMGTPSRSNLASVEERVAYWAESGEDLIVDELINGNGEESVLMARAFQAFKEQYPHIWLAVWCSPSPLESYHKGLRYADAVLPEVYLRHEDEYRGSDWHLAADRHAGFADRAFITLAIDSRKGKDNDGRVTPRWSSDRAEIERQIRSLRTARPEMMGAALYGNFAEENLIAEADDLFRRYWIMPVLTLRQKADSKIVTLHNIGAIDARDVVVVGDGGSGNWRNTLPVLEAGTSWELTVPDGVQHVDIEPSATVTLLNGSHTVID